MGGDAVNIVVGKNPDMLALGYCCGDALGGAAAIGQALRVFEITQAGLGQGCQFASIVGQASRQHASLQLAQALGPGMRIQCLVTWTQQQTRLEPSIQVSTHSSPKGKHRTCATTVIASGALRAVPTPSLPWRNGLPAVLLAPIFGDELLYGSQIGGQHGVVL